jgi:hypothetical protein
MFPSESKANDAGFYQNGGVQYTTIKYTTGLEQTCQYLKEQ